MSVVLVSEALDRLVAKFAKTFAFESVVLSLVD
jgi:hypothetical protein